MIEQVEISSIDLRYECHRMRSKPAEKILMDSILNYGIRDPLQGVDASDGSKILLNGFKRTRCAKKLGIAIVPWYSFGNDESMGILELLRISNAKSLTILEQARLIDELKSIHHMSTGDIALLLEKSKAWVSVRTGIINQMSTCAMDAIFNGRFPAYSYMYTLRPFMRINAVKRADIDEFVRAVSGKHISVRDIETLANGYFKGSDELRSQIKNGNISWGLDRLKQANRGADDCNSMEQRVLKDLQITQKYMQRVVCKSSDKRLKSASFMAQANLLAGGILRQITTFETAVKELYDRTGHSTDNLLSS